MSTTSRSELREFCHEFALATINAVFSYLSAVAELAELADAPDSETWRENARGVSILAIRMLTELSPWSVTLLEFDIGSRLDELDEYDDVRSVQALLQALLNGAGAMISVETPDDLEELMLVSPETVARLLASDRTEQKLAEHFRRQTGRELGKWPDWAPPEGQ